MLRFPIYGFAGLKGHGKDTAARYFLDKRGFVKVSWAEPIKLMMAALLRYQGVPEEMITQMLVGDLKEEPSQYLQGTSSRHAQQTLGTEWGRDLIGSELWVSAGLNRIMAMEKAGYPGAVVTDVRFLNEVQALQRIGGRIARVVRPSMLENGLKDLHRSECDIMALPVDIMLDNDGTVADLHDKVDGWERSL